MSIAGGLAKENKVAEAVEHTATATEHVEPPCSPTQDDPEPHPHQPEGD